MARKRVAILISGRGSNMAALIEAASDRAYPAEIALVISNIADAGGLHVAQSNGIATADRRSQTFGKDATAFETRDASACSTPTRSRSSASPASCGC